MRTQQDSVRLPIELHLTRISFSVFFRARGVVPQVHVAKNMNESFVDRNGKATGAPCAMQQLRDVACSSLSDATLLVGSLEHMASSRCRGNTHLIEGREKRKTLAE